MASSEIKAGKAWVEISAENGKLKSALGEAEEQLKDFTTRSKKWTIGTAAAIAGGFLAAKASIAGMFESLVSYGDKFDKMAQRTGIGTEALSEFDFMAGKCGTSMSAFEVGIRTLQKSQFDAANGSADLAKAFNAIGVPLDDLRAKKPEDQFRTVAAALAGVEDPVKRNAVAMKLLGDSGTQLMPLFNSGADGMEAMAKEARELGVVIVSEDAAAAATLGDELAKLKEGFSGLVRTILSGAVPTLTKWVSTIKEGLKNVITFTRENAAMIATVMKLGAIFLGAAGSIYAAAKAIAVFQAGAALLAAHPVLAALGVIAGVAMALKFHFDQARVSVAKVSDEMKKLAASNRQQYADDKAIMSRLEEIASKHHKTNDEIKEAQFIVSKLKDRYGDLGIQVDATTGKITGMTGAMERMAKIQLQMKTADVQSEIAEQKANIEKYQNEINRLIKQNDIDKRSNITNTLDDTLGRGQHTFRASDGTFVLMNDEQYDQYMNAGSGLRSAQEQIGIKQNQLDWLQRGIDSEEVEARAVEKGTVYKASGSKSEAKDLTVSEREKIEKEIAERKKQIETGQLDESSRSRIQSEIGNRESILKDGKITSAQRDILESEDQYKTEGLSQAEQKIKIINEDYAKLEAARSEELRAQGYNETSVKEMVDEELSTARANRDTNIEKVILESEKEKRQKELTPDQKRIDKLKTQITDEQQTFQEATNKGDTNTALRSIGVLDRLETELKELNIKETIRKQIEANEELKKAGKELSEAQESGDAGRIETAQKKYEEASANADNANREAEPIFGDMREAKEIYEKQRSTYADLKAANDNLIKANMSGDQEQINYAAQILQETKSVFDLVRSEAATFFGEHEELRNTFDFETVDKPKDIPLADPAVFAEIAEGIQQADQKVQSVGSFSGYEASDVGSNYQKRIADDLSESRRYLRDIYTNTRDAAKNGAGVFGE